MANKRKKYGNTWWGNAWISAMEQIDHDENRLPRGKSYANTGKVKELEFTSDGDIIARVKGSVSAPYKVKIRPGLFSQTEVKKIRTTIESYPTIVSEMSLGQLPEKLLDILEEHAIFLLPESWDDFDAYCSCPDWANPCKHLAAVYYLIANEIDKNPFLIFNIRGMRTKDLVESSGIIVEETSFRKSLSLNFVSKAEQDTQNVEVNYEDLDLDFDPLDLDLQFSFLKDSPVFYNKGDFKDVLLEIYKKTMKLSQDIEIEELDFHFKKSDFHLVYNPKNEFKEAIRIPSQDKTKGLSKLKVPHWDNENYRLKTITRYGEVINYDRFFDLFLHCPLTEDPKESPGYKFLSLCSSLVLSLIRSGAFIPELYFVDDKSFNIRYIPFIDRIASLFNHRNQPYSFHLHYTPLVRDDKIKEVIEALKATMPFELAFRKKDYHVLHPNAIDDLLSSFMTHFIHRLLTQSDIEASDKLIEAFVQGRPYKVEAYDEMNTAQSLSNWLGKLSIQRKDIVPAIRIEEEQKEIEEIQVDDLKIGIPNNFRLYVDVMNKKNSLDPIVPLSKLFIRSGKLFSRPIKEIRSELARQLTLASDYLPVLKDILYEKGNYVPIIELPDLIEILTDTTRIFNSLGIEMIIPKELKKLALPQLAVSNDAVKNEALNYFSLGDLLNFSYEIAIGDTVLSAEEFRKLIKSAKGLIKFRDQYILLKPQEVKAILEKINKPVGELSTVDIIHAGLTGEIDGLPFRMDEALEKLLKDLNKVDESIELPKSLNATLRAYQERGFRWLYSNMRKGFGTCLADDMGLGKTIQVISLSLRLKEDKKLDAPILVVCPTTLVGNWKKECERFAPSLSLLVYHGTGRKLIIKGIDLVITSYGITRRDAKIFASKKWSIMVIDEAQNIKNPGTSQSKAVKSISADHYIAMTGTPVENRLSELWSIFDFINKGYLSGLKRFRDQFIIPIEKYRNKDRVEKLKLATSPFILRRLKTDKTIISDLPDKVINNEFCYLTKEQGVLYQQVVDQSLKIVEQSEGMDRRGLIFKMITSLKQICNHPMQYTKKGDADKKLSGKTEALMPILENTLIAREKTLIFTQYTEMGKLLQEMISRELKEDSLFFHGSLTRKKRDEMLDAFQSGDTSILIISLKAGGTGLNLTCANNVIHYDLWWNPAVEDQATDRAFRIGQTKNVMVHRMLTLNTFEEKIDEMIQGKRDLANLTVNVGEKWITEFSNEDLKSIFSISKTLD